jgi:hypothetical protein
MAQVIEHLPCTTNKKGGGREEKERIIFFPSNETVKSGCDS